jgi:capsular polysaccharide biosynthesis protein
MCAAPAKGSIQLTEQLLDVLGSLRLLRRFWRTVAVFALVGLIVAGGYVYTHPPVYSATSLVLLPGAAAAASSETGQTPSGNDVATDGQIATSADVLAPAGHQVDPSLSLSALQHRVTTTSDATGVLGIAVTGTDARQDEALANAVANHLVTFVTTSTSAAASGGLSDLQAEAKQLNRQITDVQQEISTTNQSLAENGVDTTAGQQEASLVAQLTTEQSTLALQLDSIKSQIAQAQQGGVSPNQGTEVIQPATASGSLLRTLLLDLVVGLLGGILVGSVVVLAWHRRDRRLWTRDALAKALGSPVLLSLNTLRKRSTSEWVEVLEWYQPTSSEQWHVRKALHELGAPEGGVSEVVIPVFADDVPAMALAIQVAVAATASGLDTLFALVAEEGSVEGLQAACGRYSTQGWIPRPGLQVLSGAVPHPEVAPDLTIITLVLDRAQPKLPESAGPETTNVLAVSAGVATAEELAKVAIAADNTGQPLKGIFVANPGSEDQTTGRFAADSAQASLLLHRRPAGAKSGMASGRAL